MSTVTIPDKLFPPLEAYKFPRSCYVINHGMVCFICAYSSRTSYFAWVLRENISKNHSIHGAFYSVPCALAYLRGMPSDLLRIQMLENLGRDVLGDSIIDRIKLTFDFTADKFDLLRGLLFPGIKDAGDWHTLRQFGGPYDGREWGAAFEEQSTMTLKGWMRAEQIKRDDMLFVSADIGSNSGIKPGAVKTHSSPPSHSERAFSVVQTGTVVAWTTKQSDQLNAVASSILGKPTFGDVHLFTWDYDTAEKLLRMDEANKPNSFYTEPEDGPKPSTGRTEGECKDTKSSKKSTRKRHGSHGDEEPKAKRHRKKGSTGDGDGGVKH